MEINAQKMEALLHLQEQQAQLPRRNAGQASGFQELLGASIEEQARTAGAYSADGPAALYSRIMLNPTESAAETDPDMAVLQAAFDQASGALALWDDYAAALGDTGTTSLKDAYNMLEGIDAQVAQMRSNAAFGSNPALAGILNDLEVMTTVEMYKFNRGDYLALSN